MSIPDIATYERARRLANFALKTIDLQIHRLQRDEPKDNKFILRKWADFHYLILALSKLRSAAMLATKIPSINPKVQQALDEFNKQLPFLKKMRNVDQHIEDYAFDAGWDSNVNRRELEVGTWSDEQWSWLGYDVNINEVLLEAVKLLSVIKECEDSFEE